MWWNLMVNKYTKKQFTVMQPVKRRLLVSVKCVYNANGYCSEISMVHESLFMLQIKHKLEFPTTRNQCLTPMNQLLIALRFFATGSFQLVVGDTFAISKTTVCHTVHRVTAAIATLRDKYVKLPSTGEDEPDDDEELLQFIAEKRLKLLADTSNQSAADTDLPTVAANQPAATAMRRAVIDGHFT